MKKTYNVPTTSVITLSVQQMLLATSDPDVKMGDGRGNAEDFDTRQQRGGVGSGLWSDMQ